MRKIMSCLDVGSNKLKLVVAESNKNKTNILAVSTIQTTCMKKNKIEDKEEFKKNLTDLFEDINNKLGFKVNSTLVIVPSNTAEFVIGNSKVDVENDDNVITSREIIKAIKQSARGVLQDNMELVTIMPINFTLDDNTKVKNPTKMVSKTLEAKTVIISSQKSDVYDILECLEALKIDVVDISYDSIGDYFTFKTDETEKQIGAIVNIGHTKSTVSIINRGVLTNTSLLFLGGRNIENDISYVYKVPSATAKELKENFALANSKFAVEQEVESVLTKENEKIIINQKEISQVVESRVDEILNMIKKQINILTKKEISYIIFTGGVTEMSDFSLTLENVYGKKVTIGTINTLGVRNNIFSPSLGILKWYDYNQLLKNKDYSILSIDEEEELEEETDQNEITDNNGVIGKVFGYFFDN